MPAPSAWSRALVVRWLVRGMVLGVLLAVFGLYLRADFLVNLADQLWSCF